jgi:hypothetical protein
VNQRKTWADVEREAMNDPLLQFAVTMVRAGEMSREEALIAAALGLAAVNRQLAEDSVKLLAERPVPFLRGSGGRA